MFRDEGFQERRPECRAKLEAGHIYIRAICERSDEVDDLQESLTCEYNGNNPFHGCKKAVLEVLVDIKNCLKFMGVLEEIEAEGEGEG